MSLVSKASYSNLGLVDITEPVQRHFKGTRMFKIIFKIKKINLYSNTLKPQFYEPGKFDKHRLFEQYLSPRWGKRSKDGVTVMVCASMSGDDKVTLLVFG